MRILTNDNILFKNDIMHKLQDVVFVEDNTFDIVMQPLSKPLLNLQSLEIADRYEDFQPKIYFIDKFNMLSALQMHSVDYENIKTTPFKYFNNNKDYQIFKCMYTTLYFQLLEIKNGYVVIIDIDLLDNLEDKYSIIFNSNDYSTFIYDDNVKYMVRLYIDKAQVIYHGKIFNKLNNTFYNYYSKNIDFEFKNFIETFTKNFCSFEKIAYYIEHSKIVIYDIEFGLFHEHLNIIGE